MGFLSTLGSVGGGFLGNLVAPGIGGAIGSGLGGSLGGSLEGGDGPSLQGASDFMSGDGGSKALIAAQIANAAYNQKKQGDYAGQALDTVKGQWDGQAPLRQAGQAGMLNPGAGIHDRIAAIPQGFNPFAPKPTMGPASAPGLAPAIAGPSGPQAPLPMSAHGPGAGNDEAGPNMAGVPRPGLAAAGNFAQGRQRMTTEAM